MKDYYSSIYQAIAEFSVKSVLDVGCATGDFVFQGSQEINWTGMDMNAELLEIARKTRNRKNINYILGNIMDEGMSQNDPSVHKYDAVTLLGTLGTINDGVKAIQCCLKQAKKLFVFQGALNPYAFDVLIGHRNAEKSQGEYMFSHNMLSLYTMRQALYDAGFEIVCEEEYMPNASLICDPNSDAVKSFEISIGSKRALSNHLNMICKEFLVIAKNVSNLQHSV